MKYVVAGGTGFVGQALVRMWLQAGHEVIVVSRSSKAVQGAHVVGWDERALAAALDGADAVVNLAGASLAAGRWTSAHKARIRHSRVHATRSIVSALGRTGRRPAVLINGSAVGYYGHDNRHVTEASAPGNDFLSSVCQAWEAEAQAARALGVRVVLLRTGLVFGPGGSLPRLALPFRLFAGGPLGSGNQWVSWIHREDLVRLIDFATQRDDAEGPINAVAPQAVTNRALSQALARMLHRPCWLPTPGPLLRLALGEMADALLLGGQRVEPHRAKELGFAYRFPEVEGALCHALSGRA